MDPYIFMIAFLLVIAFVVMLPIISGIGTFKLDKSSKGGNYSSFNKKSEKQRGSLKFELSKDSKDEESSGLSSSANNKAGRFDIDSKTGLKKRLIGKYDEDPNKYDYDIDELINEDQLEAELEQAQRLERFDGSKEKAYEELV